MASTRPRNIYSPSQRNQGHRNARATFSVSSTQSTTLAVWVWHWLHGKWPVEVGVRVERRRRAIAGGLFAIAACVTNLAVATSSTLRPVHGARQSGQKSSARLAHLARGHAHALPFAASAALCLLTLPLFRALAIQPFGARARTRCATFAIGVSIAVVAVFELLLCTGSAMRALVDVSQRCHRATLPCADDNALGWSNVSHATMWTLVLQAIATITSATTASAAIAQCRSMPVPCCDWPPAPVDALKVRASLLDALLGTPLATATARRLMRLPSASAPQRPDLRVGLPKVDGHALNNQTVAHCCIGVGCALHELLNGLRNSPGPAAAQAGGQWRALLDERQNPIVALGAGALSAWPWTAADGSDGSDGLEVAFASPALLIEFVESLATVFLSQVEELVVATVLLEQLIRTGQVCIRPHTVRVSMLTALLVAHKVVHDHAVFLSDYLDAARPYFPLLSLERMLALELGALKGLDWQLPTGISYQAYTNELFRIADAYRTSTGDHVQFRGTPVPDIFRGFGSVVATQ